MGVRDGRRHPWKKLDSYGIEGERLAGWHAVLAEGEIFVDASTVPVAGHPVRGATMGCEPAGSWRRRRDNFRHPTLRGLPNLVVEGDGRGRQQRRVLPGEVKKSVEHGKSWEARRAEHPSRFACAPPKSWPAASFPDILLKS
jgi:hypothetical protein